MAGPWVIYTDDAGNTYDIKMGLRQQTANAVTGTPAPTFGRGWPYHRSSLRHVTGKNTGAGPIYDKCVCLDGVGTSPLYEIAGATWVGRQGGTFAVLGSFGERKPVSYLA